MAFLSQLVFSGSWSHGVWGEGQRPGQGRWSVRWYRCKAKKNWKAYFFFMKALFPQLDQWSSVVAAVYIPPGLSRECCYQETPTVSPSLSDGHMLGSVEQPWVHFYLPQDILDIRQGWAESDKGKQDHSKMCFPVIIWKWLKHWSDVWVTVYSWHFGFSEDINAHL